MTNIKQLITGNIRQIVQASPIYKPSDNVSIRFKRLQMDDGPEFWNLSTTVAYSGQRADEKYFQASFQLESVPRAHWDALVRMLSVSKQNTEGLVQIMESIAAKALHPSSISGPSMIRFCPALPEHKELLEQRGYVPASLGGFCSKYVSDLQEMTR